MKILPGFIAIIVALSFQNSCIAQDTTMVDKIAGFPGHLFQRVTKKTSLIENSLFRQTNKYFKKLAKQESKIKRKLSRLNPAAAQELFLTDPSQYYKSLIEKVKTDTNFHSPFTGEYKPYMDSLEVSLNFLSKNPQLISSTKISAPDIQQALSKYSELEQKLRISSQVSEFIQDRKQQIKNYLAHYTHLPNSLTKSYQEYSKQAYYYADKLKEYKNVLNDPDRILKTALALLSKIPTFRNFMNRNSVLAGLFNTSSDNFGHVSMDTLQGLQSRTNVESYIKNQLGEAGAPNTSSVLRQNIQSVQGQITQLRDKLNLNGGGSDLNMPDFKPNGQKTKSFLKRLQYGTNLQTTRSSYFFPITTDLGLSIGYKINDKNIIGVGGSYKIGWGKDIKHVALSSQGIGLRSFTDINLKKNIYLSGGFEYNYQKPFYSSDILYHIDSWQKSGLIGLSRIVSIKNKLFKGAKIQLLWDFLSSQQVPRSQPIKFRVGYNF